MPRTKQVGKKETHHQSHNSFSTLETAPESAMVSRGEHSESEFGAPAANPRLVAAPLKKQQPKKQRFRPGTLALKEIRFF